MRNIAIVCDGYSDFLVVKRFLKCIFDKHRSELLDDSSFINLEDLRIINPLTKYLGKVSKSENYSYHSEEANDLVRELITVYYGCFSKFQREFDKVTNKEIIIISSDSERLLMDRSNYFKDWAYTIKGLLHYSIERFYEEMVKTGHSYEYLPYVIPLVLFPSSEILVASCLYNITSDGLREMRPNPALKAKVYGTSSIPEAIESGILEMTLETGITNDKLNDIYKEIPEARILMQALTV